MVPEVRHSQPQYSCVITIDNITGNADEELIAFGASVEDVQNQAAQLLTANYGCSAQQIEQLIQQAKIEPISQWCSSGDHS